MELRGKRVVLTGRFVGVQRAVAQAGLEARGATVQSAVSKSTDLVFAGSDAGSKLDKARSLGIAVASEAALLAAITGRDLPAVSTAATALHEAFDRLVEQLERHPRVHVVVVSRGPARPPESVVPPFVRRLGVAPGDEVVSFYAARDGCALVWLDREDAQIDTGGVHARDDRVPTLARLDEMAADTLHVLAMPSIDRTLGPEGVDYAREHASIEGPIERYSRSFVGFDFVGDYYTPAFVVDHGRVRVQVGDDHGVFDDGRPTVDFETYMRAAIATKGSIRWRAELFGLRATEPRFEEARRDPVAFLAAHAPSIDELLPATPAARAVAAGKEAALTAALPTEPRLRALVEAVEAARSVTFDAQPDGRTLARIERADGGRQLAFLRVEERATVEAALDARRALRSRELGSP